MTALPTYPELGALLRKVSADAYRIEQSKDPMRAARLVGASLGGIANRIDPDGAHKGVDVEAANKALTALVNLEHGEKK